ncbi:MAG: PBSX family phage terminase large subunit [Nitrospira defluvii]|nr:PBSX family phage terminase large subunit [Nitrospira defluvii]
MSKAQFPAKLAPLFTPSRYKVVKGGRGGAKSWGVARALLIKGAKQRLRILCCREVQKSIKDSVHKLLKDQIELLGLGAQYDVLRDEIRGKNGTEFLFAGLSDLTAESIKSFESIDIVWVEEAQSVSNNSWVILIPTIRKAGSEIWLTMNIILVTDATYVRFIENTPPNTIIIGINWRDNPWLSKELEDERLHCKATESEEEYNHIWEGHPRITLAGAIYAREVAAMIREGRYAPCPYDPRLKVHTIWDMGFGDAMAIGLVQKARSEVRYIAYLEGSYKKTDEWAVELNAMKLNWGYDYLPFDAFSHDRRSGSNDYKILKSFGRKVKPEGEAVPKAAPEFGIRVARGMLARTVLNKGGQGIDRLMEVLKRYKRVIHKQTNEPGKPLHDEFSHGADMVRHTAMVESKLTNEDDWRESAQRLPQFRPIDSSMGALG